MLLPGSPQVGYAALGRLAGPSQTPFVPICSNIVFPSWVHFCTTPSPLPASQMLSCASTKQPCGAFGMTAGGPFGVSVASPQAFTTLPAASYSMTGGAGSDVTPSWGPRGPL